MANTVLDRWVSVIGPGKMEQIVVQGDGASTGVVTASQLQNPQVAIVNTGTASASGTSVTLSGRNLSIVTAFGNGSTYITITVLGV